MEVFFNHDRHIDGQERIEAFFSEKIKNELKRFEDRLTRVEIHLSDQNGGKTGTNDKKCVIEARPQGLKPIVVSASDDKIEKCISAALKKMKSSLSSLIGKLQTY